jgi:AcrR family transcriptional regulator
MYTPGVANPRADQLVWNLPEPPGRKHALTRAEIVAAGIVLADAHGVPGLTMRAVATELGVSAPMSLYRYVLNKDGLIDLMLDAVAAEVDLPAAPGGDWRAELRGVATGVWRMIGRHPWYAELVDSRPPFGPNMLRRAEFMLAVVDTAGFSPAITYVSLLDNYVTGSALSVARERTMLARFGIGSIADLQAFAGELADSSLEHWLRDLPTPTWDTRFELGLDCLLDGIAARR